MPALNYLAPALNLIGAEWKSALLSEELLPQLHKIDQVLQQQAQEGVVIYPPAASIFNALCFCPPDAIRVVILGQDPYHGAEQAMGLSFSVPPGCRTPPSLRNIFKEQTQDLGLAKPECGDLRHWAQQGVLLLNSVLTVKADTAGSHGKIGWQTISDALIDHINLHNPGCVFMLWGNWARSNAKRIDTTRHFILEAAHPSPLSASRGFLGCRHFSQANKWLTEHHYPAIDWSLPSAQPVLI
jgi:uracil-DNA glycosylase